MPSSRQKWSRQGRRAMDGVSRHEILEWLLKGVFRIVNGKIYSRSGRELIQRINNRNRCEHSVLF